jgi:AcrR family transcriptional regulator
MTASSIPADAARRTRRKEARPGELIEAALEVFAVYGFAATRLEDIAARAGVTKGTIYLYFADKEALFEAVVREKLVPLIAQGTARVREFEGSSADLLRAVVRGWWDGVGRSRVAAVPKLVMTEAANFPALAGFYFDNVVQPGRELLASVVARGIERGEFRAVDPATVVHFVLGPFVYAQVADHSFGYVRPPARVLDEAYVDALIDFVLHALAPAEASR